MAITLLGEYKHQFFCALSFPEEASKIKKKYIITNELLFLMKISLKKDIKFVN